MVKYGPAKARRGRRLAECETARIETSPPLSPAGIHGGVSAESVAPHRESETVAGGRPADAPACQEAAAFIGYAIQPALLAFCHCRSV